MTRMEESEGMAQYRERLRGPRSGGFQLSAVSFRPEAERRDGVAVRREAEGLLCGLIVGGAALVWKGSVWAGLSLFIGIAGGVAASAALRIALPFLLRMIRRDPQVASGPIALAAADMVTLLLYFNLGQWLL